MDTLQQIVTIGTFPVKGRAWERSAATADRAASRGTGYVRLMPHRVGRLFAACELSEDKLNSQIKPPKARYGS